MISTLHSLFLPQRSKLIHFSFFLLGAKRHREDSPFCVSAWLDEWGNTSRSIRSLSIIFLILPWQTCCEGGRLKGWEKHCEERGAYDNGSQISSYMSAWWHLLPRLINKLYMKSIRAPPGGGLVPPSSSTASFLLLAPQTLSFVSIPPPSVQLLLLSHSSILSSQSLSPPLILLFYNKLKKLVPQRGARHDLSPVSWYSYCLCSSLHAVLHLILWAFSHPNKEGNKSHLRSSLIPLTISSLSFCSPET